MPTILAVFSLKNLLISKGVKSAKIRNCCKQNITTIASPTTSRTKRTFVFIKGNNTVTAFSSLNANCKVIDNHTQDYTTDTQRQAKATTLFPSSPRLLKFS